MKSEQALIAAKYAEAIIALAYKEGVENAETIANDLHLINEVISNTPDFIVVLNHPAINSEKKKSLLLALFQGKVKELTLNLLHLLADKRRLELLPYIEREYKERLRARQNILSASLTSAESLTAEVVSHIKKKLTEKYGKQIALTTSTDKSLIGGLVLRVGDQVLDGSLKGKLQVLERQLLLA